ncbi:28S ribosomal protein L42 [Babesia caballi]|uniref:28S ribosomal protein L42 n=1 Tax=Babesia caballi TaxID=5871 RepID=A0AAV4LSB4_BABCB|nr:28S ribosomal protein L42 [Babesia caballi]
MTMLRQVEELSWQEIILAYHEKLVEEWDRRNHGFEGSGEDGGGGRSGVVTVIMAVLAATSGTDVGRNVFRIDGGAILTTLPTTRFTICTSALLVKEAKLKLQRVSVVRKNIKERGTRWIRKSHTITEKVMKQWFRRPRPLYSSKNPRR